MKKIYFRYAMNFFKKGMALSLLIFLGLIARAQSLTADGYEPNNTKETATSLTATFTGNTSTINISSASCHDVNDVDYYKIVLPVGGSYIFSTELYDANDQRNNSNYTLYAKISYSTDNGNTWSATASQLPRVTVPAGTLYLKIEPYWNGVYAGTYAAKIDLSMATTAGCTYTLTAPTSRQVTAEEATNQQIAITATGTTCVWAAASNVGWITLTTQSGTGPGNVIYSYTGNTMSSSRTGIITIAGLAYTVTQAALLPDGYEENNAVATAKLLPIPPFAQNASTIDISSANCHAASDVDYYKIELPIGVFYIFSAELYDKNNQRNNSSSYTLDAKISYSTDNGTTWSATADSRLPRTAVQAGTLYLKIESNSSGDIGTYSAKIDLSMATTAGCAYTLPTPASRTVTADEVTNQQIAITATGTTCSWAAVSNVGWITLAAESGTGSGNVIYSYTANTSLSSRTGIITVAGQAYTVTQTPRPLSPDGYEPNNTVAAAKELPTPTFTQNASAIINISPANCHDVNDVDYYKIVLPVGGSYLFSATRYNYSTDNNNNSIVGYTLDAKMSYSTDGSTWSDSADRQFLRVTVQGGTFYLKVEPYLSGNVGTYAVGINLSIRTTAGCTYALPTPASRTVTAEAATNQQIAITATGTACYWTALTNAYWITLAAKSGTGSGNVIYSYDENDTPSSRTGIITIAGQAYTVTQEALSPDEYEENNSVTSAKLLPLPTPPFTQNANTTINISSANCHISSDVDYYKIELPAGTSYIFSAELYDSDNQQNRGNYTLDARMSYSMDNGVNWSTTANRQLPRVAVQAGTLYLKIEPFWRGAVGTYAAKIDLTALCAYEVPSSNQQAPATSAIGQVEVRTASICAWTAASNASWITISAGQNLVGTKNLNFSYEANPTREPRTGTMTVAGETVTVTQAGAVCSFTLPSTPMAVSQAAGAGQVSVRAALDDCAWTAVSNAPWITIPTGQALVGTKELNFSYEANLSSIPRTGTMTVAGETVTVTQAGAVCSFTLPSTPMAVSQAAGTEKVSVRAAFDDCAWTATSNAPWITIISGQTLVGTKELNFSYSANLSGIPRTGTITIAGGTVTVTQAGVACSYTLSPTSMAVFSAAGTGKVSVTAASTAADCQWTAIPNAPWITIPTGQTLVGTKELNFSYGANSANEPREGTITIAGQTFTVKQSQVTTGFETVSPVKIFPNPAKNFVTIEVSSSNQEWTSLKITNMFGQAFYERANPEHKMQIPLTGFSSGLYFVVLQGKEKTAVQKLIIE